MKGRVIGASALFVLITASCSKSDAASSSTNGASLNAETPRSTASAIPVAQAPANACGWIPVAEVESIIGKLAGAPQPVEGACRYTLPIPASVMADRDKYVKMMTAIAKMPGAEPMKPKQWDPYAIELSVQLTENGSNPGLEAAAKAMKGWMGDSSSADTVDVRGNKNGWDYKAGHGGRLGHIGVDVTVVSSEVELPRDKLDTLAAHVRNRIPDLPFPMPSDYSRGESRDPCVLLTRQEAEAVLGPLVVPPYRSGNDGPLAYPNGTSCSYFTKGHHVLIITPQWSGGKSALAATRGVEGIMGRVMDNSREQSADTLEGPWDQAAIDIDGRLAVLKGDRLLEVHYQTSSTDEAGALKIARTALERLVNSH